MDRKINYSTVVETLHATSLPRHHERPRRRKIIPFLFIICFILIVPTNMFSFFQTNKPPYSVEKIAEGKLLDKAKDADVYFFFKHWMEKKPRKAIVGSWFVLYENEEFIYWGMPVFKRIFSDKRIVDVFYKTSKKAIEENFPSYKKIDGNTVRIRAQELILAAEKEAQNVTVAIGFKSTLLENRIEILTPCTIYPKEKPDVPIQANYKISLDKNTLELIDIQKIN